jgi:hypothetical protein
MLRTCRAIQEERRARSDAPYRANAADFISTSCETDHQPAWFAPACCKAPRHAASAIRAQEFAVPSKNPASRAAREGTRPFHAKAQPPSHRDPAILAHRQFEFRACDSFLSRASSIRSNRREKVLHLCTVRLRLRPRGGPRKRD